jgi:uncharacterized protein YegP (UPF0339 family)
MRRLGARCTLKQALPPLQRREEATMAGKFVIKKSSSQYLFNLQTGNGEIIATSERYNTKAAAEAGIESVKTNASGATTVD